MWKCSSPCPGRCFAQVCTTSKLGGRITLRHTNDILILKKTTIKWTERRERKEGVREERKAEHDPLSSVSSGFNVITYVLVLLMCWCCREMFGHTNISRHQQARIQVFLL